ncbi:hypothetical protein DL764_001115 [Monosporascus ibericus]|uniref:Cytochrome P450 n=1 Tax=Monosporascus ibericus TaxID=155417 RepID=A0A4V1XCG7_9PEZI|nr:hypothetical protein DL764_001115 [Monosporascus ibericus]
MSLLEIIKTAGLGSTSSTLFLSATIIFVGLYALYRWLLPKPLPGIPFDPESAKSLWGDIPDLQRDPEGLNKWVGKHLEKLRVPLCQALMGPFSKPIVLLADFGEARDILVGRNDFDRSSYIIDRFPLFGNFHLRMKSDDAWRLSRGWLQDLISPNFLNNVAGPAIYAEFLQLIELWEAKARLAAGKPFNVIKDVKFASIDVMLAFMFGADFPDTALRTQAQHLAQLDQSKLSLGHHDEVTFPWARMHPFVEQVNEVGDLIMGIYATLWNPKLVSWWVRNVSRHRTFFASKDEFISRRIQQSTQRVNKDEVKTGLDHMVMREVRAAQKAGRQPVFGRQIMIDEVFGELIAGEHTTSAALVWTLKFLTDYPGVQAKVRHELHAVHSRAAKENRLPSIAEIIAAKVPYLDAVIEETLRLRAAFIIPRDASRDTVLFGHRIPKGTTVLLVAQGPDFSSPSFSVENAERYLISKAEPQQFPGNGDKDLRVFDPQRWLVRKDNGEVSFDGASRPQLGFGLGPRACWGRRLALLEMRIAISMLVWKFDYLATPKELSGHVGVYDISYKAIQGYVRLKVREV